MSDLHEIVASAWKGIEILNAYDAGENPDIRYDQKEWADSFVPVGSHEIIALHDLIDQKGLRDENGLHAAVGSQSMLLSFSRPDFFEVAANLGANIIRNHPFVDGNKRTALLAVSLLFEKNGFGGLQNPQGAACCLIRVAEKECGAKFLAEILRRDPAVMP